MQEAGSGRAPGLDLKRGCIPIVCIKVTACWGGIEVQEEVHELKSELRHQKLMTYQKRTPFSRLDRQFGMPVLLRAELRG